MKRENKKKCMKKAITKNTPAMMFSYVKCAEGQ